MAAPEQKYRIIEKIDSGGMAEIYRAEAEMIQGMKKQVAIKRILPHLTRNQKFVAMFLDEARLSLFLNHANIVHVYDIGRSGDTYFIVMEYVHGVNLRGLADLANTTQQSLTLAQTLFITMEICKGLGYAHDITNPETGAPLHLVHRDVSPPNVLISSNGEVKLVDFGLAKAATQLEHTDPGVVKGKFSYLSPEAANGETVDWRADIFAVGIMLFELLANRRLFLGETDFQTVEMVRLAKIPSVSAINSDVPAELEQIMFRALARKPEDRFQHAYELQDALAQFLFAHGLKVTSRDIAALVRQALNERRRKLSPQTRSQGVIDNLIQEEVAKFTSIDQAASDAVGARPLSPDDLSKPLNPSDFIDGSSQWESGVRPRPKHAESGQELGALETILEPEARAPISASPEPARPSHSGLVLALIVFTLLGAATILALFHFGVLGNAGSNQDLAPSEHRG